MCTVMHIPPDIAFWLQRNLAIICEDDVSIAYVSSGVIASIPDRTEARWQLSVDMLYRLIKCELISVLNFADCTDIPSFFSEIQSHGPDFDDQGAYVWMAIQIYGTDKLEVLMKSHLRGTVAGLGRLEPCFHQRARTSFCGQRRAVVGEAAAADHACWRRERTSGLIPLLAPTALSTGRRSSR